MTRPSDEDDRLALLLRAVPALEPPPDFVARVRIRYAQALEARCRREAFTALATSALGLVIALAGLLSVFEPVAIIAWAGVVAAEVTTWMTGIAILLSIV